MLIDDITAEEKKTLDKCIHIELALAEMQLNMMDLINLPSGFKTPEYVANFAKKLGKDYGFQVDEWKKPKIKSENLGALLSVADGSKNEPRFLILKYGKSNSKSKTKPTKTLGLVGKGVTFDTGGLSIKPATNMHYMKSDMSGAALVISFFALAARLQLPIQMVGCIPLTENCVDAQSTKPGDVVTAYNGKTIEVLNTDAEGRLILADGLSYLTKNFQVDHVLDFATLTGSIVQALGYHACGLFSNDDALADGLYQAGLTSGDRCWRFPIWDVYAEDLKSDVADLKNISGKPVSDAIFAALFLKEFTHQHTSWAHLDIAGVSFSDNDYGTMRNASGFGLRLLYNFAEKIGKVE